MAAEWYHQTGGQQSGPVDSRELRRLAEAGIVRPDTLVRQGTSNPWVRAERVHGLFQRSTPAPSPSRGASAPPPLPLPSPVSAGTKVADSNEKLATASLVCGIVALAYPSFITGPIGSVAAIVTGILGLRSKKRGRAIAGMVLAGLALAVFGILTYLEVSTRRDLNDLVQRELLQSRVPPSTRQQTVIPEQTVTPQRKGTTAPGRSDLAGEYYFDASHGFSITFPSGWTVKKSSNPETIIKAVYRDSSGNIAQIAIAGYKLPYQPSKEELTLTADARWESLQEQYQDFSLKRRDSGTAKIRSKDAVWNTVEITAPPQGRMIGKHYHFIQGSTLYRVSAMSDSGEAFFTANLPLMDEAISTLAFGR